MTKLPPLHAQIVRMIALALGVFALAATPALVSSQPAPATYRAVQATIVNNHREPIEAQVWVDGALMKLGDLAPGERRTFALPPAVTGGAKYRLLGACAVSERIASDPITASFERHAHFIVGRTVRQSYVRYTRESGADQ